MIIVKKPSGDVIGEKLIEFPSPELVRKLNEANEEIKRLQAAASKVTVKEVLVTKTVDSPELIAKVKRLEDQITGLEAARLSSQNKPKQIVVSGPDKIIEKIVTKTVTKIDLRYILMAASIASLLTAIIVKHL